jgi:hypothetical protein
MMTILRDRRAWCLGLAGVALISTCGCGASSGAQAADPDQAQTALRAALDAWKAGGKPADLESHAPSIHVKDADWNDGFRLVSYRAGDEGKLVGFDMNYPVVLELKSPKGKAVKKQAVYTVTTRPQVLVLRQEG